MTKEEKAKVISEALKPLVSKATTVTAECIADALGAGYATGAGASAKMFAEWAFQCLVHNMTDSMYIGVNNNSTLNKAEFIEKFLEDMKKLGEGLTKEN